MLSKNFIQKKFCSDFKLVLSVFAALISLFLFFFYDQSAISFSGNSKISEIIIGFIFISSAILGFWLYKKKLLNTEYFIALIFLCGFALRLGYALKYGYNQNQHDVESLQSEGHLSYIYYIAENFGLPQSNEWQFSHPPLHHIISAAVVKLCGLLGFSLSRSFENIQFLTVAYSSLLMPIGVSICRQCNIKGKVLVFCAVLLSFHPTFFILAGSINNDILTILLSMTAILFLIKWYNLPSVKFAFLCGLFIGLAMMTKVSAALIAVVAAITVVIKFVTSKELKLKSVVLQSVLFLAIMLPLGLWHPLRNFILFEQPLGYVAPLPINNPLYTGDISLFKRIGFSLSNINGVYVNVWKEHNIWTYVLRNSLFGEYNFGKDGIAVFAVLANFVLIILSIIALFYATKKIKINRSLIPIFVLFVVQFGFFIYFNIKYPFGCSMDFRYIVPLLLTGTVFLGSAGEGLTKSDENASSVLVWSAEVSVIILAISSIILML